MEPDVMFLFGLIVVLVVLLIIQKRYGEFAVSSAGLYKQIIRCPNCGYQGVASKWMSGCGPRLLELFLILSLIIPWIIYKAFVWKKYQCPKCGNTKVEILGKQKLAGAKAGESTLNIIPCPDCGGKVSKLAEKCPHCGRPMNV